MTKPVSRLTAITRGIARLLDMRDREIERLYSKEDVIPKDIGEMAGMHMTSILRLLHRRGADVYSRGRPSNE